MKCYKNGRILQKKMNKFWKKNSFYRKHKDSYREKIIDYPDSPTGKAYVGINKSPFMPAADNGHGYQGVLIQDENRTFVQCHGCGKWMQKIVNKHTLSCSCLTIDQYKEKYGINRETGLVSDETSLHLTQNALKNKIDYEKVIGARTQEKKERKKKHSMEYFNRFGTCPEQLKTRLYEFIRCNRELPSQGNKGRAIYKALVARYGSFGHALSAHGLPWMKRQGTNMRFAFADGTVYKYNINQFHDREELFKMMLEKCPCLSSQ
jgi:hypothetical protein